MLKDKIAAVVGRKFYVNYIMYITKVYHGFFKIRHPAVNVMSRLLIPRNGVVLDIGAHIGVFTSFLAKQVGGKGRVYSFEPVPMVLRVLKTVVRLRRFKQVRIFEVALTDQNAELYMTIPLKDGWKPLLPLAHMGKSTAPDTLQMILQGRRLDDIAASENIEGVDFIKCDSEGGEFNIFSGALQLLERDKPSVLCEVCQEYLARQGVKPESLFSLFTRLGYQGYQVNENGSLSPVQGYLNPAEYIFIHPEKINAHALEPFLG